MGPFLQVQRNLASNTDQHSLSPYKEVNITTRNFTDSKSTLSGMALNHRARKAQKSSNRRCSPLGQLLAGRSSSIHSGFSAQTHLQQNQLTSTTVRRTTLVPQMKINLQNNFADAKDKLHRLREGDHSPPDNIAITPTINDHQKNNNQLNNTTDNFNEKVTSEIQLRHNV